jgi:Complex 1 protein (LYR family)
LFRFVVVVGVAGYIQRCSSCATPKETSKTAHHSNNGSAKNVALGKNPATSTMPLKLYIPGSIGQTSSPAKHLTDKIRRAEALSLYREILRTSKHFHWVDKNGKPWNMLLRQQARKDFEESRKETDPLISARMLVAGRDCLQQIQKRFNEATAVAWKRIDKDSTNRSGKDDGPLVPTK